MSSSSSQSVPLDFEPDSVYLVFITRHDHPCAGVFHHNSKNRGILTFADVETPETPEQPERLRSHCKLFSFKLKQRIETQFTIAAARKLASLHYHEWLPNETFASSELVHENKWMMSVLRRLDKKWEKNKLVWEDFAWKDQPFIHLVLVNVPGVLLVIELYLIRQVETGSTRPVKY